MTRLVRAQPSGKTPASGGSFVARSLQGALGKGLNAGEVTSRLEDAGATLLALPASGHSTHLRQMKFDIVHTALEAYGWQPAMARPPVPNAADITAMDEAFGWLALVPDARFVLRRILGARALVHPLTGRHVYPWRRLAVMLGTDHKSVQRWHAQAISLIVQKLSAP